jgi:hypothetical protein
MKLRREEVVEVFCPALSPSSTFNLYQAGSPRRSRMKEQLGRKKEPRSQGGCRCQRSLEEGV